MPAHLTRPPGRLAPHHPCALTLTREIPESLDTYYYGLMVEKYPELEAATTQMLPEGTESENTGVGGGDEEGGAAAAAADAKKRATVTAESQERNAALCGHQAKKKKKQKKDIEDATKIAMSTAKEELGLGGLGAVLSGTPSAPTYADAPTSFYDTIEGCETRAKKAEFATKLRDERESLKDKIEKEEAKGARRSDEDLEEMEERLKNVRAWLKKDASAPI